MALSFLIVLFMGSVVADENIASKKPAYLSSIESLKGIRKVPGLAVDGIKSTDPESCAMTRFQKNPWFSVDLLTEQTVQRFSIYTTAIFSLGGFEAYVGNVRDKPTENQRCGKWRTVEKKKIKKEFRCDTPVKGRYFFIYLPNRYTLVLCEVEVYKETSTESFPSKASLLGKVKSKAYDDLQGRCLFTAFHEDYTTWCVTKDYQVFALKNGEWKLVRGNLKYLSVGEAGVWGVSHDNKIFYRQGVSKEKPEGLIWTQVDGNALHVSSGPNGVVWAVRKDQKLAYRNSIACGNPSGVSWTTLEGVQEVTWTSCNRKGCWVVLKQGNILFRYSVTVERPDGLSWVRIKRQQENFKFIESSADGTNVVATDTSGNIYAWNGNFQNAEWKEIGIESYLFATGLPLGYLLVKKDFKLKYFIRDPQCSLSLKKFNQIHVGDENAVCGLSDDNVLHQRQGKTWIVMDGSLEQISCSAHQIWGIDHYNNVYFRKGANCTNPFGSGWIKVPGVLKRIHVGSFGLVHGIDFNDRILKRDGITKTKPIGRRWTIIPGHLTYISCSLIGCWGVDINNRVYMRPEEEIDGKESIFEIVDNLKMRKVKASNNHLVFGISKDNKLFLRMGVSRMNPKGSGWIQILTNILDIAANEHDIYIIKEGKELFECQFPIY